MSSRGSRIWLAFPNRGCLFFQGAVTLDSLDWPAEKTLAACLDKRSTGKGWSPNVAMSQNQLYHFGVGAPPILEPILVGIDPWPCLASQASMEINSCCLGVAPLGNTVDGCDVHFAPPKKSWFMLIPW